MNARQPPGAPAASAAAEDAELAEAEALIDLAGLRRWITCVCVVNFDVDYGQVIEYMCPRGSLTDEEGTALCYMSFPDSHATSLGDTEFVFRVRRSSPAGSTPNAWRPSLEPETDDGSGEAAPFEDATHSKRYLFGYTLFRQVKDPAHPRGTFQKSIVVVSTLPYVRLFRAVARLSAPEYFGGGKASLARVAAEMSRWPDADAGCALELPLLGRKIRCRLCVMSMRLGALEKRVLHERMLADAAEAAAAAKAEAAAKAARAGAQPADAGALLAARGAGGSEEAGARAGGRAGTPPLPLSPPPSPQARDRKPPQLRCTVSGSAAPCSAAAAAGAGTGANGSAAGLGGGGGAAESSFGQKLARPGAHTLHAQHASEAPLPSRSPWAEAEADASRTRSVPLVRALVSRLPARPSLGDALGSALDCFAPFQDISLLRAFSPAPQAAHALRPQPRAAAGAGAGGDSGAPSPPGGGGGAGGGLGGGLGLGTGPRHPNGIASPGGGGLGALASFGGAMGVAGGGGASAYEAIWSYWELVLTGASILVHSSSPTRCSDAVLALVSLVAPIPFCGDFRPYFTIHDADFERYTTATSEPPPAADGSGRGVILGVTNPYFLKLRQPWHALVLLDAGVAEGGALQAGASSATNLEAMMSRATGGGGGGGGGSAGKARRAPVVTADPTVLKRLTDVLDADMAAPQRRQAAQHGAGAGTDGVADQPVLARRAESDLTSLFASSAAVSAPAANGGAGGGCGGGSNGSEVSLLPCAPPVQRAATLAASSACSTPPPLGERAGLDGRRTPPAGGSGGGGGSSGVAQSSVSVSASAHKIGNELLRQHFRELTAKFLRPLEHYGTRGFVPAQADWSRPMAAANGAGGGSAAPAAWMQTFDRERFLRELWVTESSPLPRSLVSRRSDLMKLYEAFLDTPHFRLWWHERRSETLRSINRSYQEKLATAAAKAAETAALQGLRAAVESDGEMAGREALAARKNLASQSA